MATFRIELLHRADEHREPFRAERYDIHTPDLDATVVQAKALFRVLSPGRPSLASFRIMENSLIVYEANKGELADARDREERSVQPITTMHPARLVTHPF